MTITKTKIKKQHCIAFTGDAAAAAVATAAAAADAVTDRGMSISTGWGRGGDISRWNTCEMKNAC